MKKILVKTHRDGKTLVGDSLFMLPFFKYWADKDGLVEYGPRFNSWVSDVLPANYILNSTIVDGDYTLDPHEGWTFVVKHGNSTMHIINGIAHQAGLLEDLSLTFPFKKQSCMDRDIVIAPFGSEYAQADNRVWQIDKWIALLNTLTNRKITIVGSAKDDYSWCTNCEIISGASLAYVAGVLANCKLFVSIDSGPANLATMLGIKKHVLLYPHNCEITANPYATKVRINHTWPRVTDIPVEPVVDACQKCLGDSYAR